VYNYNKSKNKSTDESIVKYTLIRVYYFYFTIELHLICAVLKDWKIRC